MTSERENQYDSAGQQQPGQQQQQGGEYAQGQADYGSPRGGSDDGAFTAQGGDGEGQGKGGGGGEGGEGMSKEEWLRQNPDGAYDPPEAPGEGMSKEEWLRQNPGEEQNSGKDGGGRF